MIPEVSTNGFINMLTLTGHCPGMESIVAVSLKKPYGAVGSYLEKKQTLRLYYTKPLEEMSYAVVHEQQQEFEEFQIRKRIDKLNVRIVRGMVDKDGTYLLRIQEDSGGTEYLVRYVVNGKAAFKKISTESMQLIGESEDEGGA